ncbi:MAG: ParB N-terminal domain-containing protein [Actinomycetota bacterium]|nr:ParB N-terminal domain-containing protein [Actinomycetota bacterium]
MEVLSDLGNGLRVTLTERERLIPHEEIIEQRVVTRVAKLRELGFYKPIVVDEVTGTILDGHHKTAAAGHLNLDLVPVLLLDYLIDDRITVEVWPGCGRTSITKTEVLDMAASGRVFSPKTSRHVMPFALPELAVPLEQLHFSTHSS